MVRLVAVTFVVAVVAFAAAGCADILGLDPLGPAVRSGEDEQEHLADAAADASDQ